jgi:hypothetical protein
MIFYERSKIVDRWLMKVNTACVKRNYKISFIYNGHLPVQWQAVEMRETCFFNRGSKLLRKKSSIKKRTYP